MTFCFHCVKNKKKEKVKPPLHVLNSFTVADKAIEKAA